ncbi:MAG: M50 family metallopeptidase [Cyanobacteria bacterium P01_G01_bin.38]
MGFDVLSLLYGAIGLDTLWRLKGQWQSFWDNQVTRQDRFLAQRVAAFLLIPIGVFFHELGHAIAVWQVGGRLIDFQWRIAWGYVTSVGDYTPLEDWWIALSGNLVSIALGLLAIPLIKWVKKPIYKEILTTFAAAQLVYSAVFYPIYSFTSLQIVGDWVTIYDFSVSPYAQLTAVAHGLLLVGLWYALKVKQMFALPPLTPRANAPSVSGEQSSAAKTSDNKAVTDEMLLPEKSAESISEESATEEPAPEG